MISVIVLNSNSYEAEGACELVANRRGKNIEWQHAIIECNSIRIEINCFNIVKDGRSGPLLGPDGAAQA
jgi:hypothetical protein